MLERPSPPCLEDLQGALPSAGALACTAGAPSPLLLDEASAHFIRLQSRAAPQEDDLLSEWLQRSSCHRCAWRRIARAWDLLATAPRLI